MEQAIPIVHTEINRRYLTRSRVRSGRVRVSSNKTDAAPFAAQLERWGEATAIVQADGGEITYARLASLADDFAAHLASDVRLLAVEASSTLPTLVGYLGALRRGVPVVLCSSATWAAIGETCAPDATYGRHGEGEDWRLDQQPLPWQAVPHSDLAVLLSTSGTTGGSKFVRLSHRNLQANAESIVAYIGLKPDDRAVSSLPLSYSYGLSVINSHLAAGASILLTEASAKDAEFRDLLDRHRVTGIAGVPSSYDLMEQVGLLENLPGTVRTLTQAGGRMSPETIARVAAHANAAGARLFVMYGQTEATARIAYLPPELVVSHPGFIGKAIAGGELWVEGADGGVAPVGVEGELIYRGPNVMMGYAFGRSDLSQPAGPDLLRTGDIAIEAEPGLFRITGRKSRFVKPFGLRIGLDDLETRCLDRGGKVIAAGDDDLIVLAGAAEGDLLAARSAVSDLDLPADLFEFVRLDAPPLLENGKVDYRGVLQLGREARAACAASRSAAQDLKAFFHQLARGRELEGGGSFEALGGDSLNYVQCSILVEEAVGYLPRAWEKLSLAQILQPAPARTERRRFRWLQPSSLESDTLARCVAITIVVLQHTLGGVRGGSDVLMLLAGFSWARFQRTRLIETGPAPVLLDFARRYVLVYLGIMLLVFAVNLEVDWSHLLFVSTYLADWGGILNIYWFIECLTWCIALTCFAFLFPAVRKASSEAPIASALVFVGLAFAARLIGGSFLDAEGTVFRTPDQMLPYFAVGWAMALSPSYLRVPLALLLCATSGYAWGWTDSHVVIMAVLSLLVALVPRVRLPFMLARLVTLVAAASFYIYLMNAIPMHAQSTLLGLELGEYWLPFFVLSMLLGIGLYFAVEMVSALRADGWRAFLPKLRRQVLGLGRGEVTQLP